LLTDRQTNKRKRANAFTSSFIGGETVPLGVPKSLVGGFSGQMVVVEGQLPANDCCKT